MTQGSTVGAKIFGIGFHKTGTKSLAAALGRLGYRVHGPGWTRDTDACMSIASLKQAAFAVIDEYDAFQDNPWPLLWQDLAQAYPDARFILTYRDSRAWFESARRYFGAEQTPMRALIYGADAASPLGNEQLYIERFERHNQEVRGYFAGRDNFLELDVSHAGAHGALCRFLGHPVTSDPFPHLNQNPSNS